MAQLRCRSLLAFLMSGATISLALAVGSAWWSAPTEPPTLSLRPLEPLEIPQWERITAHMHGRFLHPHSYYDYHNPFVDRVHLAEINDQSGAFVRAGWPLRMLQGARLWTYRRGPTELSSHVSIVEFPPTARTTSRLIPVGIVWPAFLVNTVTFAALVLLVVAFARWMIRFSRSQRARCGSCGYPVGASECCTECGASVSPLAHSGAA